MIVIPEIITTKVTIKYLYHISDIHIRRYDRHNEYEYVFDKLYNYLKTVDSGLIVITGDILHNKDNLTPDCITKTRTFLETLSNIMPVIMIAGNHDIVENNNGIRDSLKAILDGKQYKNIHYLEKTGVYIYGNIKFGVFSLTDKETFNPKDVDRDKNDIFVGLYHGGVGENETAIGHKLKGDKIVSEFDGFDYTLLGDIHKFQYVSPTMAYASSLISQNFSEVDKYHGVLIWDLVNKEQKYKIIDNKYRYINIEINNDKKINIDELKIPKYGKVKLSIDNCSSNYIKKLTKSIKKKYNKVSIYESYISNNNNDTNTVDTKDISYLDLLDNYMGKLSKEESEECKIIFSKYVNQSELETEKSLLNWKLLKLEFSNMFTYGENNIIDFTKLPDNDITGIFAPNSYGKSTIIDILLFTLYETFSRNVYSIHRTIPSFIVNNKSNEFEVKLSFSIGSYKYIIHKKGKLKKKNTSKTGKNVHFDINKFYKIEDGITTDLTGKDRFETNKEIINVIGNYTEFCLTTLYLQNGERNFYDMQPRERKDFLYKLLGLNKFENMAKKFKPILKENNTLYKDCISRISEYGDINDIENEIKVLELNDKKYKEHIDKIKDKINKYELKKEKLLKQINPNVSKSCVYGSIDLMENRIKMLHMLHIDINYCNNNDIFIKNINDKILSLKLKLFNRNGKCELTDTNECIYFIKNKDIINQKYDIYIENIKIRDNYLYQLQLLNDSLKENEINRECSVCMKRIDIVNEIENKINNINNKLDNITINDIDKQNYDKLQQYYILYDSLIQKQIDSYNEMLYKYNQMNDISFSYNFDDIIDKYNNSIQYVKNIENYDEYNNVNTFLLKLKEKYNKINEERYNNNLKLNNLNSTLNNYNKDIKKSINYLKTINIYSALVKSVSINGIPTFILNKYVGLIEEKVNNNISKFINKEIKILLDGTNLNINVYTGDEIVNILGGMETFIMNIAFKITLANISVLPKCNMLIIDEGVSVLDKEHIDQFNVIANFLKKCYKNVILISHIDGIKDFIMDFINITKNDGKSNVVYL